MKQGMTRAPCRNCLRETNHEVVATRVQKDETEISTGQLIWWKDTYEMLQCAGCGAASLRHTHFFSEDPESDVAYYPPPVSRPPPMWRGKLPPHVRSLLQEVYSSLHADSRRLAVMGARTLVDMMLLEKVGDVGSFRDKLAQLETLGFVGTRSREFLAAALDAGSAAAHRGFEPEKEQLGHVMDIVENLLQAVYALESAAADLRGATPPRSPSRGAAQQGDEADEP